MIFNVTGGGGAALNFKVLAYATEEALLAATPAENTTGIITETPITSWIFSATEPSPAAAGMVWITTGTSSSVEFNALKKNGLQVYPISAKQYVGGAWVDKTAKSYQGGEWVDWWDGELYVNGDTYDAFTGGWTNSGYTVGTTACGTITNSNNKLTFNSVAGSTYPGGGTAKKINTSRYKTLRVIGVTTTTDTTCYFGLYIAKNLRDPVASFTVPSGSFEKTVNIENYNDEYYIGGIVYGYLTKAVLET